MNFWNFEVFGARDVDDAVVPLKLLAIVHVDLLCRVLFRAHLPAHLDLFFRVLNRKRKNTEKKKAKQGDRLVPEKVKDHVCNPLRVAWDAPR